ncbi:MAG: orotidine-5'-phosphate decarboxylase [Planctomycetota bacterium]|jgi:orotidine-5'-phosphate decarboxylase|nr:orotidine-5'-phosphate decarboxylase [Planctomycetota bacterium]
MHVADQLQDTIDRSGSLACVGLDPRVALLPPQLREPSVYDPREAVAAAFLAFNTALIDAIAGHCACVKPQVACYEAYGAAGMRCLEATIAHARERGIPVIVDAKRNDIGSTATHYRQAWLGTAPGLDNSPLPGAGGDWLTINGYLGSDGVTPFLGEQAGQGGVFVLVKTSNPGSAELQGIATAETGTVMEAMAALVDKWGANRLGICGLSDVGAVVGATWPQEARTLRAAMPNTLFLVPGYGAQGGTAADALAGIRSDGRGVIVNSSRGIIAAWQQSDTPDAFADAARAALEAMNADLASAR